jgi:hypothetical protein
LATSNMGRTRSGREIVYTEASYGRAARAETARKRKKRKLSSTSLVQRDNNSVVIVGGTPPRRTRGQIRQEASLGTPPSVYTRVGATPPSNGNRVLRGTRAPTCSDYGMSRHYSFQGDGFFFCNACDVWDSLLPDDRYKKAAGPSRQSRRVACTANHDSFCHPTTMCKDFCRSAVVTRASTQIVRTDDQDCADEEESDSNGSDGSTARSTVMTTAAHDYGILEAGYSEEQEYVDRVDEPARTGLDSTTEAERSGDDDACSRVLAVNNHPEQILALKAEVRMLRDWNRRLVIQIKKMKDANGTSVTADDNGTGPASLGENEIVKAIKTVTGKHNRRWKSRRTGSLIAAAVWNCDEFQPHFLRLAGKYFRDNVFTPYNILREMDLSGGTLSYEGIDILRRVETQGVKYFRGSIIPSKSEIKRCAGSVEWYAREHCPFTMQQTTKGESIQFDYAKAMLCITKAFHLDKQYRKDKELNSGVIH